MVMRGVIVVVTVLRGCRVVVWGVRVMLGCVAMMVLAAAPLLRRNRAGIVTERIVQYRVTDTHNQENRYRPHIDNRVLDLKRH